MRFIEDFQDRFAGKEIWILGSGPSLDDYPKSFFDDKISIGMNATFLAFPHCTLFLSGHQEVFETMLKKNPILLKRTIYFIDDTGYEDHPRRLPSELKFLGKHKEDLIYATINPRVNKNPKGFRALLKPTVEKIIKKQICHLIAQRTVLHAGIQCAAILGAKKITLIGCEAAARKGRWHAQRGGMPALHAKMKRKYRRETLVPVLNRVMQAGTKLLTQTFAEYQIEVSKYYYRTGYEKIV